MAEDLIVQVNLYKSGFEAVVQDVEDLDVENEVLKKQVGFVDEEDLARRKMKKMKEDNLPIGARAARRYDQRIRLQLEESKKL